MLPAAFEMYDDVPKSIVEPKHRLEDGGVEAPERRGQRNVDVSQ